MVIEKRLTIEKKIASELDYKTGKSKVPIVILEHLSELYMHSI